MLVTIHPAQQLKGTIHLPGDKSISHRGIILGAISRGKTVVNHFLRSADCLNTMRAFQAMGVQITHQEDQVVINGEGISHLKAPQQTLQMGNSGTTTRLLSGVLAGRPFSSKLEGDPSLSKRPMRRITVPLSKMGARIQATSQGTLPIHIQGSDHLQGIHYVMPVASAQVKSSLILAALQAQSETTIVEPIPSRDHTERMLEKFSPQSIQKQGNEITICPQQPLKGQVVNVPGDMSSAAFYLVAGALVPNSKICLKNVGINSTRSGLLKIMERMGAQIQIVNQKSGVEPSADLLVKTSTLKPVRVTKTEIPALIDEVPLVALLAARAKGISKITGAQELRYKESDRLQTTTEELQKLGIAIKELPDGFVIDGRKTWEPQQLLVDSHHDHRIAMMLAVAGLLMPQPIKIKHADSIKISYPQFFRDLQRLEVTK